MSNIREKISTVLPDAVIEDGDIMQVTVPDAKWHDFAKTLRDDSELAFDFLVTIVGMDWKENGMGCIYYLASTRHNERISVKVMATGDRERPFIHSIHDLWAIATVFEREVYDFFGIIFINNPDMRRLFLNLDWKGFPLRKDYNEDPDINPVSIENERQTDFTDVWTETPDGKIEKHERRIFQPDDFVVNIGPQHPATHGVLRFRTAVDGEIIKKIDIYLGYIHRGVEKICEKDTYPQTLHFMDRLDYFSAHPYHHCLCMLIEEAAGIQISRRAQVIRVLMDELSRIASHCLFIGTYCMDLGATTMLFYTLRVREQILDIMERDMRRPHDLQLRLHRRSDAGPPSRLREGCACPARCAPRQYQGIQQDFHRQRHRQKPYGERRSPHPQGCHLLVRHRTQRPRFRLGLRRTQVCALQHLSRA